MTRRGADEAEHAAAVIERLAALLAGGATPASAWQHVAGFGAAEDARDTGRRPSGQTAARVFRTLRLRLSPRFRGSPPELEPVEMSVARGMRAGQSAGAILVHRHELSWRALGCAWALAERTGAPLAQGLSDLAQTFRDFGASEREVELALAGPSSAARLVMALPAVGVLLGVALGFDSLGVLFGSAVGAFCLLAGLVLLAIAHIWNRGLIASASNREQLPGFALDLTALGMLGGASATAVRGQVDLALQRAGLDGRGTPGPQRLAGNRATTGAPTADRRVERVLTLAREAGVPAASLLRSEAALARREARAAAARSAAELGVRLMLPLGLCVLPSFLLLGVAPLILAVITQTVSRL
ncbi:type II secretion system F family protein [Pseudoclavibacter helvolus]|uniref:type II secretion system F family protein n=1 Tax=Pseudoclavibacter helvolus TaxID=255205 RepID=UPI003C7735B2